MFQQEEKAFLIGIGIFLLIGLLLGWGIHKTGISAPESCYLSPHAATIELALDNFEECKSQLKENKLPIDIQAESLQMTKIAHSLVSQEQTTNLTQEAIEDLFTEVRDKIEESNSYKLVNDLVIILFLFWLLVVGIILMPVFM